MNFMDLFGYGAALVVFISFLMKDIKKLRMLNILGCIMFLIYGIHISAIPTIIINIGVIIINVYQLYKEKNVQ
jgi:hypothetical protein